MAAGRPQLTLAELAAAVAERSGGRLAAAIDGDGDRYIDAVAPLESAGPSHLTFLANVRYRNAVATTRAGAVVLTAADHAALQPATSVVVCEQPYAWFAFAAQVLNPVAQHTPGIDPTARIDPDAKIGADVWVGPGAVVEAGTDVGVGCRIEASSYVGSGVRIGANTRLYPGVRVLDECSLGARCVVHSGAVIGADGFGFAPFAGAWIKIPQTGRVIIGADVEIGANTTIDRGAIDDTIIEEGVKLDNLIQVGHNVRIGAHSALAACVGISGSTTIGKRCMIGGEVGIAGHLAICDDVVITGFSMVSRSITRPGVYSGGFPVEEANTWRRLVARFKRSDSLVTRLKRLERAAGAAPDQEEDDD